MNTEVFPLASEGLRDPDSSLNTMFVHCVHGTRGCFFFSAIKRMLFWAWLKIAGWTLRLLFPPINLVGILYFPLAIYSQQAMHSDKIKVSNGWRATYLFIPSDGPLRPVQCSSQLPRGLSSPHVGPALMITVSFSYIQTKNNSRPCDQTGVVPQLTLW